jgi:hypothetical protein
LYQVGLSCLPRIYAHWRPGRAAVACGLEYVVLVRG